MRSDVFFGCSICGKPLTNGTDTFGDVHFALCWNCYAGLNSGGEDRYYGLAPHIHRCHSDGSITTEMVPLETLERTTDGEYLYNGLCYAPGLDAGLGFWSAPPAPGWR